MASTTITLPNEVLTNIIEQFIRIHRGEGLDWEREENVRLQLRLREVNRFFNEETIKAMLAHSHPNDIRFLCNPEGGKSIEAFRYRDILNEIVSGKIHWEWKVLMGSIIDSMMTLYGRDGNGDAGRERMIHLICCLLTDIKFNKSVFNLDLEDAYEGKERVVREKDLKISCFIIAMATNGYGEQEMLKEEGLDFDYETTFFGTPLNVATRIGRFDLVEVLLSKGADPDLHCSTYSTSPREVAAQQGKLYTLRLLYDPRFPAVSEEKDCDDELNIAKEAGTIEIISFFLDRHDDCCSMAADEYLMNRACQEGDLSLVERFVDGGVSLWELSGVEGVHWERPIVAAARCGHLDVVEYLLDEGAENENEGGNAFAEAATNNHFDIVFMMFERGFREEPLDWDDEDEDEDEDEDAPQFIDLEEAYNGTGRNGNVEAAQKIWEKYDTRKPRKEDWCSLAFHWAVCFGHPGMIEWFVEKMGNNIDLYPFRWENAELVPLVEAVKNGRPESVECLLRLGAKIIDIEEPRMKERIEVEKMTHGKVEALKVLSDWKEKMGLKST